MARRAWSAWCQDWPIEVEHKPRVLALFHCRPALALSCAVSQWFLSPAWPEWEDLSALRRGL